MKVSVEVDVLVEPVMDALEEYISTIVDQINGLNRDDNCDKYNEIVKEARKSLVESIGGAVAKVA